MVDARQLIEEQADFISRHQLPSGAIPWYEDGVTDPWDHIECAIALALVGRPEQALKAYRWLRDKQNDDGSWYLTYLDEQPHDLTRDANYSSYIATGIWYHYGLTGDAGLLRQMWPSVERGIEFALSLQQPSGEIYCACSPDGEAWPGAILGSSCCVWRSLQNGVKIAEKLGFDSRRWHNAGLKLARAIRQNPQLFDKYGENKQGFATNWYYPVLTGAVNGPEARDSILRQWNSYVVDGWGCKCVASAPWVTVAETTELIMTLCGLGEIDRARLLMKWILRLRDHGNGFHTGIKLPELIIWPDEKNTWTSAGVIMAVMAQFKAEGANGR